MKELRHQRGQEKNIHLRISHKLPHSVLHAHEFAHSTFHSDTHTRAPLGSTLIHLQVTNWWLTSTPHTRWPPDSTKHTQSPLQDCPCPVSAGEHALQSGLLQNRARLQTPETESSLSGPPRVTSTRHTGLPAHGAYSVPSPAEHTRSPIPVTAPGRAVKTILTGSASKRASPGAAPPARAHCSPASPRRKSSRPRRAPAGHPGRPPTPATAVAAAAARAEGEAQGAGPRALRDRAAPSCLERATKPGRERCEVRAAADAGGARC